MIKQKITEYTSHFLVETRLTFTKKEAEAFYLDKNLIYYNIVYLDRKYIYLNKQKAIAEEIKEKIKASIDA